MFYLKQFIFATFNLLYRKNFTIYKILYFHYKNFSNKSKIDLLNKITKHGMVAIDVGANVGFYSIALARLVGPSGQVYAFEPDQTNYKYLKQTTRLCKNIKTVKKAVGNKNGQIRLYISNDLNVDHQTYDNGQNRKSVSVPSVSLDSYFKNTAIDLLKIDAQGFDYQVIKGASGILKKSKNLIILGEFWPYGLSVAGSDPNEYLNLLKKAGFKVTLFDHLNKKKIRQRVNNPSYYTDFLAIKSSKTTKL